MARNSSSNGTGAIARHIGASYRRRKAVNRLMTVVLVVATVTTIVPLFSVFGYVLLQGLPALNWAFLTQLPVPVGEVGGGMANSLVGTLILVFLASLLGIPWGLATGLFLSEYGGRTGRLYAIFVDAIRFSADMLSSIPSIIVGLFAYTVVVLSFGHFSALAGGFALGILMIPTVARSTEELLKMVPQHIREAGLALGLPRWKVIVFVILKGRLGAILTGILLALARVAGETAPLLFTAFNNRFWSVDVTQPMSSLPVQIYTYAISPYSDWHRQAWAGALVLLMVVFVTNIGAKLILSRKTQAVE